MATKFGDVNNAYRTSAVQTDSLGQPTSCYATLGGYNSRVAGTINAPVAVASVPSQAVQAIPVWGSQGYESLSHGAPYRCGGYFTIDSAYPDYSSNCGQYVKRACAGVIQQPQAPGPVQARRGMPPRR